MVRRRIRRKARLSSFIRSKQYSSFIDIIPLIRTACIICYESVVLLSRIISSKGSTSLIRMVAFPKGITIMACLFLLAVVSIAAYAKYTDDLAKKITANSYMGGIVRIPSDVNDVNWTTDGLLFMPPEPDYPFTSYDKFVSSLPTNRSFIADSPLGTKLLLPEYLPNNLKPTGVYGIVGGNVILFTYSANGYNGLSESELVIQITSTPTDPYLQSTVINGTHVNIGQWTAYYNPAAPEFEPEYINLYGHTCGLLNVRVGTLNYQFRAIPDIAYDELIQIVENMKPVR